MSVFKKKKSSVINIPHNTDFYTEFKVYGAGRLRISNDNDYNCGGEKGFRFGVEWGPYGFYGGVIPTNEAIKLAKHILNKIH